MFDAHAEIQTSPALIALPNVAAEKPNNSVGIYDFLSKSFAFVAIETFYWLEYFQSAKQWNKVLSDHPHFSDAELFTELNSLVDVNFLTVSQSEAWAKNQQYREQWKWDLSAGLFHFTIADNIFFDPKEATARQLEKLNAEPSPPLFWEHGATGIRLPDPGECAGAPLLSLMAKRRTNRTSQGNSLRLEELSQCLFAGLGITGHVQSTTGTLPLSMTPSGGARNPFEAFVFVKRCDGLAPGVYHYSAHGHTLRMVNKNLPEDLAPFLAEQEWVSDKAVVIVLAAVLERTMWKYPDPNAYRVVLIESGHIAQNIMLAATDFGLSACPTAALCHAQISSALKLDRITHVPIYALTLDKPLQYPDTVMLNYSFNTEAAMHLTSPAN